MLVAQRGQLLEQGVLLRPGQLSFREALFASRNLVLAPREISHPAKSAGFEMTEAVPRSVFDR